VKILGRDPVVFANLVAVTIALLSSFFLNWSDATQGIVNAAVLAVAGVVVWWKVSYEKGLAALVGAAKPLMALALAFGVHLTAEQQSSVLVFVTMAAAFWLRGQVTAPVDIYGNEVPKIVGADYGDEEGGY
jgi:hypothetical protein